MRRKLLAFVLAAACAVGSVSCGRPHARTGMVSGDMVTFGDEVRRVGDVRVHKSEQTAVVKMVFTGEGDQTKLVLVESLEREVRRDEVLAVEGTDAKKLRVTYVEKTKATAANGQPKLVVSPVSGKVFIVDRLVGRTVITHEDGTPLGLGEEEIVASDYKPKNPTTAAIEAELEKPMKIGAKIDALAALLRRSLPDNIEEARIEVVLTGVRDNPLGQVAVFSVAIEAVGPDGDMKVGMNLKGELLVRIADGASIGSDIGGDLLMFREPSVENPGLKGAGRIRFVEKTEIPP